MRQGRDGQLDAARPLPPGGRPHRHAPGPAEPAGSGPPSTPRRAGPSPRVGRASCGRRRTRPIPGPTGRRSAVSRKAVVNAGGDRRGPLRQPGDAPVHGRAAHRPERSALSSLVGARLAPGPSPGSAHDRALLVGAALLLPIGNTDRMSLRWGNDPPDRVMIRRGPPPLRRDPGRGRARRHAAAQRRLAGREGARCRRTSPLSRSRPRRPG